MGFRSRSESHRDKPAAHGTARGHASSRGSGQGRRQDSGRAPGSASVPDRGIARGYVQKRPAQRQAKSRSRGSGDKVRDLVLSVLRDVTVNDAFGNLALPKALAAAGLKGRDAAFATELAYGTLRATGLLDVVIAKAAGRPVEKIDSVVLDILRLGSYQILKTRVEHHAAVDTSVELAKANGAGAASGFVNGVLRQLTRSPAEKWIDQAVSAAARDTTNSTANAIAAVSLRHSHPEWIGAAFNQALGAAPGETSPELEAALAADDERPIVHLAARPGQITAEELALVSGGDEGRYSPYAVYLTEGTPGDVDAIREGMASVQDEGSQLIALATVRAATEQPDNGCWLDLCSGPGGKTAFIASYAIAEGATVDAVELAEHRADLVRKNTEQLPVTVATGDGRDVRAIDGLIVPEKGYDRVLVDAPCSGLGALRRRPEARWRKSERDIPQLVALQRELLTSALDAVADGGVVVYSTCSPHPAETTGVVSAVCARTEATVLPARGLFPELEGVDTTAYDGKRADDRFIQLWPHKHGTDAMFIAVLRPATRKTP